MARNLTEAEKEAKYFETGDASYLDEYIMPSDSIVDYEAATGDTLAAEEVRFIELCKGSNLDQVH